MVVATGSATHTGLRRTLNEDAFLAESPVFLVADGMGGHEAGERASAAVVAEFRHLVDRPALVLDDVRAALARARHAVEALSSLDSARAGTTLSGLFLTAVDGMAYWLAVNIGDSRTYRLSGGVLEQISVDHSVVQELIDSGELSAEAAVSDTRRNIITRAIGAGSVDDADYWMFPAELGDRMLICSDGLSSEVIDGRIRELLATTGDPQVAADLLIESAIDGGGRDNITVVVLDAISVASRAGGTWTSDDSDIDADTRPREAAPGGIR